MGLAKTSAFDALANDRDQSEVNGKREDEEKAVVQDNQFEPYLKVTE